MVSPWRPLTTFTIIDQDHNACWVMTGALECKVEGFLENQTALRVKSQMALAFTIIVCSKGGSFDFWDFIWFYPYLGITSFGHLYIRT